MDPLKLPQVQEWVAGGTGFDPRSFVRAHGTLAVATAFSMICRPALVEYRGGVFLEMAFDREAIDSWFTRLEGHQAVEAVVNHLHIWDLFAVRGTAEEEAAVYLASVISDGWRVAAATQFPGINFDVSVSNEEGDYGPTVTLTSLAGED